MAARSFDCLFGKKLQNTDTPEITRMSSILVYYFTVLSTILTRTIYTNAALTFKDFHQRIPTILILNLDFRLKSETIFGKHSILSIVKTISQIYLHGCSFSIFIGIWVFYITYLSILFLLTFGKFLHCIVNVDCWLYSLQWIFHFLTISRFLELF